MVWKSSFMCFFKRFSKQLEIKFLKFVWSKEFKKVGEIESEIDGKIVLCFVGKRVWEIEGRFVARGENDWTGVGIGWMFWY